MVTEKELVRQQRTMNHEKELAEKEQVRKDGGFHSQAGFQSAKTEQSYGGDFVVSCVRLTLNPPHHSPGKPNRPTPTSSSTGCSRPRTSGKIDGTE